MRKTILIITDNLPEQINGVVTTYTNIETHAAMDGYNFVVLHPGWFRHFDCPKYNEVKIAYPRNMGQKIEAINPDHIHIATEGPLGLWARAYLSLGSGRTYSTAYHTKFPEGLKKILGVPESITWRYVKWFHKYSGKVLTTTDTMVKDLKDHGFACDIISWTRGVDRTIFNPGNRAHNGTLVLVCVSRVSKEKNLEKFFELDYPGARKIMVGDGPMRLEYQRKYPNVEFVGAKRGQELGDYYRMADVFVFPSRWETFGIVMIEAMACGTPVAAYPVAGPLDVVDEGITGCLDENLELAVAKCLKLDRQDVTIGSERWSWQRAWEIFKENLV
jgi:glycosyltransferase involved in cell wall biosynthesis